MAVKTLVDTTTNVVGSEVSMEIVGNREGVLQIAFFGTTPVATVTLYGRIRSDLPLTQIADPITTPSVVEIVLCNEMSATVTGIGGTNPRVVVAVQE